MSEQLPRRFAGHLLLEQLGRGGAGEVFLAKPRPGLQINAPFAVIKRLRAELAGDAQLISRFEHEALLAVQVDSEHLVRVYEVGTSNDERYLVLEHVPGWTFSELIKKAAESKMRLPIDICSALICGVLRGLADLHEARDLDGHPLGAIHRDLAPKNLMLRDDGIVKVIDLGIGKSVLRDFATQVGVLLGSPGYMAPEQVRAEKTDVRGDLYIVGSVAFELFTSYSWIERAPTMEMLVAALKERPVKLCELRRDLPASADAWAKRALEFDARDRYASAVEMRRALEAWAPPASAARASAFFNALAGEEMEEQRARTTVWLGAEGPTEDADPVKTVVFAQRTIESVAPTKPLQRRKRTLRSAFALPLLAALITSAAVTVSLLQRSVAPIAPVYEPNAVDAVEAVRAAPRVVPAELEQPAREQPARTIRRQKTETPPAQAPIAQREEPRPAAIVVDPRARLERLRERAVNLRRSFAENVSERARVLELELDLEGARDIEDADRLSRVLDKVERELDGLSR